MKNLTLLFIIGEWDCDVLVLVDIEKNACKCVAEPQPLKWKNKLVFNA